MNGAYQGAAMNQQHYAGMVGQQQWQPSQAVPTQQNYGSRAASSAAGFASSMAAPAMTIGAGMMGLDPFSMAFKGGAMGMRMGGMAGMAGGAIGGFALASGGAAAAMYGVNQGFTGVQQQQQLQQQLGETYRFRNQFGGQGFTQGGMQNIGSMMRGMTTQQGPMGESTSFEELGRLAQNMARMGMDQGVRNAKDFSDKFRQMVKTLKEVATTMGTSLEEAQKMMAGMKNVGVFKTADQARAFGLIKAGTDTGILSSSEMMSAGSIGSQISRSIGGTGKAGMNAGLKALSQIGTMQQMGLLTEEQIFNSTGLSGAEGRQALATQQLSSSGRFLGTARGRYFMASIAGKDGQLDPSDVMAYMQGSVSVEETRKRAYSNLSGVGRANFIRNTGRLKGAALEQFGGSADAMALMGWMGERGINVNTDSDRAMLFLQRTLHKGRDEADQIVEQVRNMPQILRQQISNEQESKFSVSVKTAAAHQGLEAIKHKFAKVQSEMNASLQQTGADMVSSLGRSADVMLGSLFGSKATFYQGNVLASSDIAAMGGATGAAEGRRKFGWGGGLGGMSSYLQSTVKASGAMNSFGLVSTGMASATNASKLQTGLETLGSGVKLGLGQSEKQELQSAWFTAVKGDGQARVTSLTSMLSGMGGNYAGIADKIKAAGPKEQGSIIAALMRDTGTSMDTRFQDPAANSGLLTSKFVTADQGLESMGAAISGHRASTGGFMGGERRLDGKLSSVNMREAGYMGGAIGKDGAPQMAASRTWKTSREAWIAAQSGMSSNIEQKLSHAAGEFLMSDTGKSLVGGTFGTTEEQAASRTEAISRLAAISESSKGQGGGLSITERGEKDVLTAVMATGDLQALTKNGAKPTAAQALSIAKKHGFGDTDMMLSAVSNLAAAHAQNGMAATRQLAIQAGERAAVNISGITDKDALIKTGVGGDYIRKRMEAEQLRISAKGKTNPVEQATLLQKANDLEAESFTDLGKMSGKERQDFLTNAGGVSGTGWLTAAAQQVQGISKMLSARGSDAGTRDKRIATSLGLNLTKEELKKVKGMDTKAAAAFIAEKSGGLMSGGVEELTQALDASRGGRTGEAATHLARVQTNVSQDKLTAAKSAQDPSYEFNKATAKTLAEALGPGGTVIELLRALPKEKVEPKDGEGAAPVAGQGKPRHP